MKSKYITSSQLRLSALGAAQMQMYQPDTLLLVTRSGILRHTLQMCIRDSILHVVDAIEERIKKTPTNLERLRKQAGYSQTQLAELSTVSLRSIQMYEQRNNDISKAQFNILDALAKVLKCSVYDLVDGAHELHCHRQTFENRSSDYEVQFCDFTL